MEITKKILSVEKDHFNRLSSQAKQLIKGFTLFNLIFPIFSIFTMAYLWRQSHDIILVAIFNLGVFAAMPVGFYINGYLLKKFYPSKLYFSGILFQAIFTAAVIFSPVTNYTSTLIYGLFIGLSAGLIWSNRAFLVVKITSNKNMIYFISLDSTISLLLGIVVPVAIGSFIIFGQSGHLYSPVQAYYFLSLLMFLIVFFIFNNTKNITSELPQLSQIFLKKPSKKWLKMRFFAFIFGLLSGLGSFVPIIMVMQFIGKEDALGTVQSLSAVVAAIIIYTVGKKITVEQRGWIVAGNVLFAILAGLSFAILYSKIGVFIYFIFQSFAQPLGSIGYSSIYYGLVETENQKTQNHYSHIVDSEIYINSGRIIGITAFILFIHLSSQAVALRYTLLFFTFFQILLFIIARSIDKGPKTITVNNSPLTIDSV